MTNQFDIDTDNRPKMSKKKKLILILVAIAVIIVGVLFGYSMPGYYANQTAADIVEHGADDLVVTEAKDKMIVFEPDDPQAGFIFYPGAKIQYEAYAPLLSELAQQGVLCVVVKMPFNLAVAGVNKADGIKELYPDIDKWYIGGHSVGGVAAGMYLGKHAGDFEGLVLLASYITTDLSQTDLSAISVYGSKDKVLELDKYEENKVNLPADFEEYIIDGGNHAYFGSYGDQDGDGIARITNEEQIEQTVKYLTDFMLDK